MHSLLNVSLIPHNFTCLHKLFEFDCWNSFILHTLVTTRSRRINIFDMPNQLSMKSLHSLLKVSLIPHNYTCSHKLFEFESWNTFILYSVVFTHQRYRFNIFDMSNQLSINSFALLVQCFLNPT